MSIQNSEKQGRTEGVNRSCFPLSPFQLRYSVYFYPLVDAINTAPGADLGIWIPLKGRLRPVGDMTLNPGSRTSNHKKKMADGGTKNAC